MAHIIIIVIKVIIIVIVIILVIVIIKVNNSINLTLFALQGRGAWAHFPLSPICV